MIVEDTNFFKNGKKIVFGGCIVSFLYPAGYSNSMWILDTQKLDCLD